MQHRAAFPPTWIVVVLGDLVESELFIVVGTDPLRRVDRALFQRGVDFTAGDLLRHRAKLGENLSRKSRDAEFQALEIGNLFDLLAEPAAHLRAGIAGR